MSPGNSDVYLAVGQRIGQAFESGEREGWNARSSSVPGGQKKEQQGGTDKEEVRTSSAK